MPRNVRYRFYIRVPFSSLKNFPQKYRERQTFKKEIKSLDQQLRQSSMENRQGQTKIAKPTRDVAAHNA